MIHHHDLSLALMRGREPDDIFRAKYFRRVVQTFIFLCAMVGFTVTLIVHYGAYELEEIWASGLLRPGLLGTIWMIVLSMSLALAWAFWARAIPNRGVYEQLLRYQVSMESAEQQDGTPVQPPPRG